MKKFIFAVAMMTAFATTTVFANTTAVESVRTTQQVNGSTQYNNPVFSKMMAEMFRNERAYTPSEIDDMTYTQAANNLCAYFIEGYRIYICNYGDTPEIKEVYDFFAHVRKVILTQDENAIKDMLKEWYYMSLGC